MPITPPFQYTPQMLAQMAQAAFRPPGLMSGSPAQAPGLNMGGMPQSAAPGFNMADGAGMLSQGLADWKPNGGIKSPNPDGSPRDFDASGPWQVVAPTAGAASPSAASAAGIAGPSFLSGAPAGVTPEDWALMQQLGLSGSTPYA